MNLQQNGDLIDLEFNAICRREGYQMLEVPVFSTSRHSGRSTTNWRSAVWDVHRRSPAEEANENLMKHTGQAADMWTRHAADWRDTAQVCSQWKEAAVRIRAC